MHRHKIFPRNAITDRKNEVVTGRRHDGPVQDFRLPESAILMPHAVNHERAFLTDPVDDPARLRARTIVRHHDLEVSERLAGVAQEHEMQNLGLLIRGDDD
jgi:hypothetical protein